MNAELGLRQAIKDLHIIAEVLKTEPAIKDTIWLPERFGGNEIGPTLYEFIGQEIHNLRAVLREAGQ